MILSNHSLLDIIFTFRLNLIEKFLGELSPIAIDITSLSFVLDVKLESVKNFKLGLNKGVWLTTHLTVVDSDKLWYAGDNGQVGFVDIRTTFNSNKQIVKDNLKLEFNFDDYKKNHQVNALFLHYVVNPISLWKGKTQHKFSSTRSIYWKLSFIAVNNNQNRNFAVGWANKIVSPVPGRIIAYDGRTLHTTHPTAAWCPVQRRVVAFRVSKKQTT